MPDRLPEAMPDRLPEDMPDKMPEDMSDRMPEDLSVTKRIDVMVGKTRSKVIITITTSQGYGYPAEFLAMTAMIPHYSYIDHYRPILIGNSNYEHIDKLGIPPAVFFEVASCVLRAIHTHTIIK